MTRATNVRGVIPVLSEGQRLTVAREYVGLTQGELAQRLGVTTATVQRNESGKTQPRRTTFMAWSMATGVDLDWLQYGTVPTSPPDDGGSPLTDKPSGLKHAQVVPIRACEPRSNFAEAG